jgi:DNA-binding NarL/FixJ family response regulator
VGEASDGGAALRQLRAGRWDVVLLDLTMPGQNGLEVLKQIRLEHPALPVLIVTMHPEEQFALRALKAGASGYVAKDTAPAEVWKAVRKVLAGGKHVSASLAERLAAHLEAAPGSTSHQSLTDREYEVLCLVGAGKTTTQISRGLSLSPKTVSTYRMRIVKKLGLESGNDLVRYAIKHGLSL